MTAGPSWRTINRMEQARWRRFAKRHRHESAICAALAESCHPLTVRQIGALAAEAREHGWPFETAGRPKGSRRRRR